MNYTIVITPYAHEDEYEAYCWYEEQRAGLGEEFLHALSNAYKRITKNPLHYGFIDERKVLRDVYVRRFPYLVIYRINGDVIEIVAVHHTKRHPSKKYGIL